MSKENEPNEIPPLYIRERMAMPPKVTGVILAERMDTTPATISRLLNGQRKMTLEWLYAFSKALQTPIEDMFSPPGEATETAEAALRSALIAYGVDREDLSRAISAVKIFIDDDDEQLISDPTDDQFEPSSRRRVSEPSE